MSRRIPNPGESKSKFITREFVKQVLPPIPTPGMNVPGGRDIQEADTVLGVLGAGATITEIEPYRPFVFSYNSPILPSTDNLHLSSAVCTGYAHNETSSDVTLWDCNWGIALDYIRVGQPGRIQVSGWAWLKTTGAILHGGVTYDIFNRKLFQLHGGSAKVYYTSGEWALVKLGTRNMKWVGRSTVSGVSLSTGGTVFLYEPSGNTFVPTTIDVGCVAFPSAIVGQKWVEVSFMGGSRVAQEIC